VPGDISIVGFDDIDLAAHMAPPLTTMRVDKVSMGRMAVQMLAYRVEFPEAICLSRRSCTKALVRAHCTFRAVAGAGSTKQPKRSRADAFAR
jgi:DNA-binding LacI/PurR family transcriptional regulator